MERVRLQSQVKMLNAMMMKTIEENKDLNQNIQQDKPLNVEETKNITNSSQQHEDIKK